MCTSFGKSSEASCAAAERMELVAHPRPVELHVEGSEARQRAQQAQLSQAQRRVGAAQLCDVAIGPRSLEFAETSSPREGSLPPAAYQLRHVSSAGRTSFRQSRLRSHCCSRPRKAKTQCSASVGQVCATDAPGGGAEGEEPTEAAAAA